MLICNLTGNLGNHLFQYALTRRVAEANGYEWGINPIPEYDYHNGKPQMDFLDINYGVQHSYKYSTLPDGFDVWEEKYDVRLGSNNKEYKYFPFQPEVFAIRNNTKLIIPCAQHAYYFNRKKLMEWFKIAEWLKAKHVSIIHSLGVDDINTTVINVRGGEYKGVPDLLLNKAYWNNAIFLMKERNPDMRFVCVTDDVEYASELFSNMPVIHLSIGGDYYIINNARNLILSNSSFAIFPTWLNKNKPFVIAPKYWARHNVSAGRWANSYMPSFPWNFMGRDGSLS